MIALLIFALALYGGLESGERITLSGVDEEGTNKDTPITVRCIALASENPYSGETHLMCVKVNK